MRKLKKVFLSHSSEDDTLTDNVYRWLMNQSYIGHIWIDKVQLRPGDDLKEIDKGIASSDFVIPIITSNSIKSEWVRYEIKKAFKKGKKLLPIIKDCKIPDCLKGKKYISIDDKLHGIEKIIPGILRDYHILELDLDSNLFKIEEEKFIIELNKFFLGANKGLCYAKINTNLFERLSGFVNNRLLTYQKQLNLSYEDEFRKAHLFTQQLQILWHNLSYMMSELVHHIVKKIGNGSFTIQVISTAVKNIIINVHFFIVLQITNIISTNHALVGNSAIINYFNEYVKYQTHYDRYLEFINTLYYSDKVVKNENFQRIGFVTKPGIYHPGVIDLASFDFMERIEAQKQYNLAAVLSDNKWYTKCIPQIIASFLDDITFKKNIPCRKSKVRLGFCMNDYEYLGIN